MRELEPRNCGRARKSTRRGTGGLTAPRPDAPVADLTTPRLLDAQRWRPEPRLETQGSILRQHVNLAKLSLNLLYALGAARVVIGVVPARFSVPPPFFCPNAI